MHLGDKDIVRHKLVTRIVNAYDAYDREKAEEKSFKQNTKNESINKD